MSFKLHLFAGEDYRGASQHNDHLLAWAAGENWVLLSSGNRYEIEELAGSDR